MNTLFINARILTMQQSSSPTLLSGAVGVVDNRIALVSEDSAAIESFRAEHNPLKVIDCQGKLLMPGLINTHTHIAMTLQRCSGDDVELMQWLNELVWPFEARQSDEDILAGSRLGFAEMLLGGTTTAVEMYWSESWVAKAANELGIRAILGESCLEGNMPIFETKFEELLEATKDKSRLTPAVAPHAPYTCTPEILKRCVELSGEHQLPFIIHLAETQDEVDTIRERYDMTPTEYLDSCGVLGPRTILAHSIYLTPSDMELIAQRGSSVAHNPQCNMKIASGVAPISKLMDMGVNCAIGTDGVCSNNDLDMWDEMRTAALLQKLSTSSAMTLPAYDLLKMVTVNGAKSIGREGELGVIREGALADIICVNTHRPHYRPHNNLISALVYCGKAADVEHVMVDGVLRVENYTLIDHDIEAICQDVDERSAALFQSLKG